MLHIANSQLAITARASKVFQRHGDDFYAEPRSAAEALFRVEAFGPRILDPFCGTGRIVRAASRAGYSALGADIAPRWLDCPQHALFDDWRYSVADFAKPNQHNTLGGGGWQKPDAIVSNPPYRRDMLWEHLDKAIGMVAEKVAFLLPADFWHCRAARDALNGRGLCRVYSIIPRPSMPPNICDEDATTFIDADGDVRRIAGGAKDFVWAVFLKGYEGATSIHWLDTRIAAPAAPALAEAA